MIESKKCTENREAFPATRLRRLRRTASLRRLVRETHIHPEKLILPLFIKEGLTAPTPISTMPGHFQWPVDALQDVINQVHNAGLGGVLLFGIPAEKDAEGSRALAADGIVQQAIKKIKATQPDMLVIADLCFCEYTDHGHCGILAGEHLDNDATLPHLSAQAVSLANAGADIIAPSGMLDGMVHAIRAGLDREGLQDIVIMSYAVKYASALYGPFREAAEGAPQLGDRRHYQMDPANIAEALREAALDVEEGADILMVKPGLTYLDVIQRVKTAFPNLPMAAYHVSGEYSMVKAAAAQGYIDEQAVMLEQLMAMTRAGADIIITYAALEIADK